jgi:parallel beta-helix repeat protein
MKTRKTLFASLAFLFLGLVPILAMSQSLPNTFSANTAAKASEVNENFTYLLERFGTRKTSVNCSGGESIATALQNYNHIVISGICTENLSLDPTELTHRLVILEGSNSSSDGISASDTSIPVVDVGGGEITLKIKKLKLTGGTDGIKARRGPAIIMSNILIENNSEDGIALWMGSNGIIKNSTIQNNGSQAIIAGYSSSVSIKGNTISGHTNESSILIYGSSGAYIVKNTITGGKYAGIAVSGGSFARIGDDPESGVSQGNTIQSANDGILVKDSGHAILKYNTINNNSEKGLVVENNGSVVLAEGNTFSSNNVGIYLGFGGSLNMKCDEQLTTATTISDNTVGPIAIEEGGIANLCNLTLNVSTNGIGVNNNSTLNISNLTLNVSANGIGVNNNSTLNISNSSLTSSSGRVIYSRGGAAIDIDNTTITGNSSKEAVKLNDGSNFEISRSTVSGGTTGISAVYNSTVRLQGGNTITGNTQIGIYLLNSTLHQYSDAGTTTISSNTGSEIKAERSFLNLDGVTITGTGGSTEVDLRYGSLLMLGSGSSVTGTVTCGNTASDNGSFVNNSGTSVTTSGC